MYVFFLIHYLTVIYLIFMMCYEEAVVNLFGGLYYKFGENPIRAIKQIIRITVQTIGPFESGQPQKQGFTLFC